MPVSELDQSSSSLGQEFSSAAEQNRTSSGIPQLRPEEIEREIAELSRSGIKDRSLAHSQIFSAIVVVVIVGLVVLGFLGGFRQASSFISEKLFTNKSNIRLVSTRDQNLVILVEKAQGGEVKLLNLSTGGVQDISSGDIQASHAALSPKQDIVAYVSTDAQGSSLYLVSKTGNITEVFNSTAFNNSAISVFQGAPMTICEWSDLYWAPKGDHLAFFGCSGKRSVLFIVPAQADTEPDTISNTESDTDQTREAVWLTNGKIAFTGGKQPLDSLFLVDPIQQQLQRLYGPIK